MKSNIIIMQNVVHFGFRMFSLYSTSVFLSTALAMVHNCTCYNNIINNNKNVPLLLEKKVSHFMIAAVRWLLLLIASANSRRTTLFWFESLRFTAIRSVIPSYFHKKEMKNRSPQELRSCTIPFLLIAYTRGLKMLATALWKCFLKGSNSTRGAF